MVTIYFVDTQMGSYIFKSKESVWVTIDVGKHRLVHANPHVWVKEGEFLFSPQGRIVDGEEEEDDFIPPCKNDKGNMIVAHTEIGRLPRKEAENEVLRLCMVKTGGFILSDFYEDAVLAVDLITIDDKAKPTVLKSLLFDLDATIHTRDVTIDGIFPM